MSLAKKRFRQGCYSGPSPVRWLYRLSKSTTLRRIIALFHDLALQGTPGSGNAVPAAAVVLLLEPPSRLLAPAVIILAILETKTIVRGNPQFLNRVQNLYGY